MHYHLRERVVEEDVEELWHVSAFQQFLKSCLDFHVRDSRYSVSQQQSKATGAFISLRMIDLYR